MKSRTIFFIGIAFLLFAEVAFTHEAAKEEEVKPKEEEQTTTDEENAEEQTEKNAEEQTEKNTESDDDSTKKKSAKSGGGVLEKTDDIKVSSLETRKFRGIVLENRLEALLIQDEDSDTAAMSMFVGAGSSQGPVEIQGLPNLVQFLITDGNKKYKNPNDFMDYMSDIGGYWNGVMYSYKTGFYCTSPIESLLDTMDRFSALFYKPLFEEKRIEATIKIINDMYEVSVEDEESRLEAVKIDTFKKDNKLANFQAGNTKTLKTDPEEQGINIQDEVKKFFNDYYSSDKMYLVLLGKESLDDLENIVVEYFSGLEPNDVELSVSKHGPLREEQLKKRICIVAIRDTYYLELDFAIPDPTSDYKYAPMEYMRYFLENKAVGSLYSFLHKSGLITDIWMNTSIYDRGAAVLEVRFDLTKNGLEQYDTIILHFFEYLAMVQQNGIQETAYEEIKEITEYQFEYSTDRSWLDIVYNTAQDLVDYPITEVLSYDIPQDFKKKLLQEYMDCLTPDNMRVILRAKQYADEADQTAEMIPVKYYMEDIAADVIEGWKSAQPSENFAMPKKNECIPENFDLLDIEKEYKIPEIVEDTDLLRVWLYQDSEFRLPMNYLGVYLRSPKFIESAKNSILADYFATLFSDAMVEYTYDAVYAGYTFSVYSSGDVISLYFDGYSDKFTVFLGKVFEHIKNFEFTPEIFEIKKDEMKRNLENLKTYDSYQLANYYMWMLLSSRDFTEEELLVALEEVTIDDAIAFNSEILKQIFVEAYLYGNCDTSYAKEVYAIIENCLADSKAYKSSELVYSQEIILQEGGQFVYPVQATTSNSYAITSYYQCSPLNKKHLAVIELFSSAIENSYQDAIRVKEQISYMFFKSVRQGDAILGLYMTIQSTFENSKLDEILEKYLASVENVLQELSDDDLKKYKSSLKYTLLMKFDTMSQKYWEFAGEISSVTYDFNQYKTGAAKVDDVTKDDLVEFYNTYIKADASKRTKLLVYVIPAEKEDTYQAPEGATIIGDIWEFRKSQEQSDPPKQHGDYPPIGSDG